MKRGHRTGTPKGGYPHFYGRHAIIAALANPERVIRKIWGTREAIAALELPQGLPVIYSDAADMARYVPRDAPHQGIVAEVEALEDIWLGDLLAQGEPDEAARRPILVLDQVTDPHNVGAILRSAAAFDALGIVTQDRHAPPESGVIARAAAGALEFVPWVRVVNLARALDEMAEAGYWRIALDGGATETLDTALNNTSRVALVLGAEGEGLRLNSINHCDMLAKLPISRKMESLNVSNAAAIALYACLTR
ncbi:MAG: 23S rRNA (guanosine(2251)-2'-O)-methyltransferase RlmB [Sphingobium sp.]|nr:23S rRNA (guanosine(2251)-2'-O)-methyltransferase RlmB [Sphingobium sp.]